jgi:N-acetylated-alpha-linked acidic dipeptidase
MLTTPSIPSCTTAFHGLSTSGNVTAEIVYAAYCRLEDFALLKERNISVEGKIVLCKYGGIFRGLKVKGSEDNGAIGTLIYSGEDILSPCVSIGQPVQLTTR